jgi:hypothetical protein
MTTEAEQLAALFQRAKFPGRALIDALNSTQTTFDDKGEPTGGDLAFCARVTDSPVQVSGLLGTDGVWRITSYLVSIDAEHELDAEVDAAKAAERDMFVMVDGSVAEAMVKFAIPKMLAELTHTELREAFTRRLAQSRFAATPTIH